MVVLSAREPCPWLPVVSTRLGPETTRRLPEKRADFYLAALSYAQSLWLEGKPAQAILQLNKAWMADLHGVEPVLTIHPSPYRALRWIIQRAVTQEGFMGNPVRHFQHLASRMSGPRSEIRSWRAWGAFHVASSVLGTGIFSRDGIQLAREGLWIPSKERVANELRRSGWQGEAAEFALAIKNWK